MKTINMNKATNYECFATDCKFRGGYVKVWRNFMVAFFGKNYTMEYWRADTIEECERWLESAREERKGFDPDILKAEIVAINWV